MQRITRKERTKIRTSSNIKVQADDDSSNILKNYNADAMTLGQNILFSKDKFNLRTASGFGLLIHELTHVRQLRNSNSLYSNGYGIKTNQHVPSSMWEKEALDNEKLSLKYFKYLDKKQRENTNSNYGLRLAINNSGLVGQRKLNYDKNSNLVGFNSVGTFHQGVTGKDGVFGYRNNISEDLNFDLDYAKDKIDDLIKSVSVERTNHNDFSRSTKRTHSPSEGYRNEQIKDNRSFDRLSSSNDDIPMQDYPNTLNTSVPLLSFGEVLTSGSDTFKHLSEPNLIHLSPLILPILSIFFRSIPYFFLCCHFNNTFLSFKRQLPSHSYLFLQKLTGPSILMIIIAVPIVQNSLAPNAGNTLSFRYATK